MTICSSQNAVPGPEPLSIKYVNKKGEDLLNPDHHHAITEKNINVYYLINGKKEKVYYGNLDYPKNLYITRGYSTKGYPKDYLMIIWPYTPAGHNTGTTYIVFKDYPTDTLKVHYKNHGVNITKIWYNGKLKRTNMLTITKHLSEK